MGWMLALYLNTAVQAFLYRPRFGSRVTNPFEAGNSTNGAPDARSISIASTVVVVVVGAHRGKRTQCKRQTPSHRGCKVEVTITKSKISGPERDLARPGACSSL